MYRFFFGFVSKSSLNPSAFFFSVLLKSLILIHEFTSPTPKQKGSPTPAGYKAARFAEYLKGRCGRPLATRPRVCEAPAPAGRTRRGDPSPRRTRAPHQSAPHRLRPLKPPRAAYCSQPATAAQQRPRRRHWATALATPRPQLAPTRRRGAG